MYSFPHGNLWASGICGSVIILIIIILEFLGHYCFKCFLLFLLVLLLCSGYIFVIVPLPWIICALLLFSLHLFQFLLTFFKFIDSFSAMLSLLINPSNVFLISVIVFLIPQFSFRSFFLICSCVLSTLYHWIRYRVNHSGFKSPELVV